MAAVAQISIDSWGCEQQEVVLMCDFNNGYSHLVERFIEFAHRQPEVRAAAVIGSRAREDHPADEWSDLDILMFVNHLDDFVKRADWYEGLGEVWLSFITRTPRGDPERRVLYAGGQDIDFALNSSTTLAQLVQNDLPPEAVELLQRGVRILIDKDGMLQTMLNRPIPSGVCFHQPDEASFVNLVHDFWFHTLWTAKHLCRGELWWAKTGCDIHLKNLLTEMLKWQAHAVRREHVDTWIGGRFLEEWADPRAVTQFKHIFARYDRNDIARALLETMQLFQWLAVETAQQWSYEYPQATVAATRKLVEQLLASMDV